MKNSTKVAIISTTAVASAFAAIHLLKNKKKNKIKNLKFKSDELNDSLDYLTRIVIGYNIDNNILLYQTRDNNIKAVHILEDKEEVCRVFIPSENAYTTFSVLFGDKEVSYLLETNDFEMNENYTFEIGVYCSKTGKFIDALVFDSEANVFIKD